MEIFRKKDSIGIEGSFIQLALEFKRKYCANTDAKNCYHEMSEFTILLNDCILAEILRNKLRLYDVQELKSYSFKNKKECNECIEDILREFLPFLKDSNSSLSLPKYYPLHEYVLNGETTTSTLQDTKQMPIHMDNEFFYYIYLTFSYNIELG